MDRFRVLLVDDEEELVTALVERLGFRSIDADYALGGLEALEKMKTGKFDVVVLDLKLPGMDGVAVLKSIKKEYPQVPVLMITGHGSVADPVETRPEEAYDFLPKPIDIEDLIDKMKEAVAAK